MAPKATPAPIVAKLHDTITAVLSRPDIKKSWEAQGAEPMLMTQPQFAAFMQAQVDKWAKVIKANHITLIN
jgi:tripartite-type tricarboxylate transporter receptor subunit TctC